MTDDELIDAYRAARCGYETAKAGEHGNRVDAFVQLVSAQMALIGRYETSDYVRHYCERHELDALELATNVHPRPNPN